MWKIVGGSEASVLYIYIDQSLIRAMHRKAIDSGKKKRGNI